MVACKVRVARAIVLEAISCAVGDFECKLEFIIIFGSSGVFTCR